MRIGRNALLRGTLGIVVSVVAVWILVQSVDIGAALEVLGTASPAWIAVMFLTTTVDIAARGARWRALLAPIAPLPYRHVLGYTYIGYLANNVLPARLGELYRSHALGEGEHVSRPTVLGTVVVERVVDTVMVVAIASVAVLVLSVRGVMSSAVLLGLAFVALLVIAPAGCGPVSRSPGVRGRSSSRSRSAPSRGPLRRGRSWPRVRPSASSCRSRRELCSRAVSRSSRSSRRDPATSARSS
jgi:uncharacterized membrane protein YbhN (UPF0104 family)